MYHCPLKNKNSKKQRQKQKQNQTNTKQNETKQIKTKQNNNKNTKKNIRLLSILNRLFITTNAQQAKKNYLSKTLYTHKI